NRDENRGGFKRDDNREGGFRGNRDENRGGFKRDDNREGGFRGNRDENRGGFKRDDNREGGFRGNRDENRGGFKRDDNRGGGFKRDDNREGGFRGNRDENRGGFKRDDNRGGGFKRDDNREGGFRGNRDENRGGFKRDDNRGGFKRDDNREGGFRGNRDDNRGGFKRDDNREGGFRGNRDDNRGGGFKRDDNREGGFRGNRDDNRGGGFKRDDNRGEFRGNSDRPERGNRFDDRSNEAPRAHNPGDLRISNRPDREQSPDIDEDVTGKELDRVARAQLRYLEERSASWVAKHLVMAGRLLEDDPELAYEHTMAASRRGGRVAVVREAVGIAAYHAGKYADSLRELRTHRRISGSDYNLPLIADSLRGLGRAEKAIELAHSDECANLESAVKVEMHIVAAGAYGDLGKLDLALAELESLEQLDFNRAYSFSPRLFTAYADLLAGAGRTEDSKRWFAQVSVAERALGIEAEADSFIMDLAPEMDEEDERPRAKDLVDENTAVDSEDDAVTDVADSTEADVADVETEEIGIDEEDALVEVDSVEVESETVNVTEAEAEAEAEDENDSQK
ncbi:hypothetical protein, partial [Glutamicibacter sp.]|uniref:hypothetical protein n=1 Tax=Glutamicibacter sp. TaxID=1931995 RepID=UPI002FDA98CD